MVTIEDEKKAFEKLLILRSDVLTGNMSFEVFLKKLEVILFNEFSKSHTILAGGDNLYCYSTITIRLLGDEDSVKNLKIDLTTPYY